jgi:hypothetical protein
MRLVSSIVVLVAVMILPLVSVAQQRGQREGAPAEGQQGRGGRGRGSAPSPTANLPFDPKDLNGYWDRSGGGDRGVGSRAGADAPPMTPEGQKLFDANRPGYGPRAVPPATGNDIVGECNPQGIPRIIYFPRPVEFIQRPDKLIQVFDWHRVYREIWMDGRQLPKDPDLVRWYGYSVGRWEGNTLVVDSNGFDDRTWLDMYGYPHSDQMLLQERYTRVDHDTITLQIIVNDPKIYTKPWVGELKTFKIVPKETLVRDGWFGLLEEICAPIDEVDSFNTRIRNPAAGVK